MIPFLDPEIRVKAFRLSYLTLVPKYMILAENYEPGVNADRIPVNGVRVSMYPGESVMLSGDDAETFRRQLEVIFPRASVELGEPRGIVAGTPYDPDTGEPESSPPGMKEG